MGPDDRPAAEGIAPGHFPAAPVGAGHVEPCPRRIRGMLGGAWVFDTTEALYAWDHPYYPQLQVPAADVVSGVLADEGELVDTPLGEATSWSVRAGGQLRAGGARSLVAPADAVLSSTFRFRWSALDHWFEEDEEVFVHPRSPYVRVDALRSSRPVRVELGGKVLADAPSCVIVFETGLPPRYYLAKVHVDWSRLEATDTVTECPYKGRTSGYWTARVEGAVAEDVAWGYDLPTRQVQPVAGMVAFVDTEVDVFLDGEPLRR